MQLENHIHSPGGGHLFAPWRGGFVDDPKKGPHIESENHHIETQIDQLNLRPICPRMP